MLPSITFPATPEETVGALAILGLMGLAIGAFCRWLLACPRTPDPWGAEVEQELEGEDAVPVCPHCLAPQQHNGWFCPECGSTTGQYSNYLPYVYIFSMGEAARAGVQRRSRWTPLLVAGYVLIAITHFYVLAPVYCLFLFLNRARVRSLQGAAQADESGA
jgi:prepilin signal peptidase PulO-like enzyme (type II secretory pathway)